MGGKGSAWSTADLGRVTGACEVGLLLSPRWRSGHTTGREVEESTARSNTKDMSLEGVMGRLQLSERLRTCHWKVEGIEGGRRAVKRTSYWRGEEGGKRKDYCSVQD